MKKIFIYSLLSLSGVLIIVLIYFNSIFSLFGDPIPEYIKSKCDHEGLRSFIVYKFHGNNTTNPSIHVAFVNNCGNDYDSKYKESEDFFVADKSNITDSDVSVIWTSFDTIQVSFNPKIRIIKKLEHIKLNDSTLNVSFIYLENK